VLDKKNRGTTDGKLEENRGDEVRKASEVERAEAATRRFKLKPELERICGKKKKAT